MKAQWTRSAFVAMSLTIFASVSAPAQAQKAKAIEDSVVKIFVTVREPDPARPWNKRSPKEASGSGVVIEGRRILTNAHVVRYANQIQVQANQSGDKLSATVVAVAPGIDLAVLKLDDESFFTQHPALARANSLPNVKDEVLAYGFPVGGTSLSITKGIVSRIEFVGYNFPTSGLRIQVDAAINPGNSGGPAIANGQMIGLAFGHLNNAQNVGYIIPNEEIELFLQDMTDGNYDGKLALYDEFQSLESPALRSYLKLDATIKGVLVREPYRDDAGYPLKTWDVITRIGPTAIDEDQMVNLNDRLRVNFRYLVQKFAKDGKVPLTIVRNNTAQQIQVPVSATRTMLVPDLSGDYPPYFIYGPLVFTKATNQYLAALSSNASLLTAMSIIGSPMVTQRGAKPTAERQELVIIAAPLFPHRLSKGYKNATSATVYSVNDVRVKSLAHLVALLRDLKDEFVIFKIDQRGGETYVFPRKEMEAASEEILADNDVRTQGSPDMLAVWQGKKP